MSAVWTLSHATNFIGLGTQNCCTLDVGKSLDTEGKLPCFHFACGFKEHLLKHACFSVIGSDLCFAGWLLGSCSRARSEVSHFREKLQAQHEDIGWFLICTSGSWPLRCRHESLSARKASAQVFDVPVQPARYVTTHLTSFTSTEQER